MNKASGSDGISAEQFQILKGNAVKVLHSIYQQMWKTQQWPQDWKRLAFIPIPKERQCQRMLKLPHSFSHLCFSHASETVLKILQARLQQYVNQELTDVIHINISTLLDSIPI